MIGISSNISNSCSASDESPGSLICYDGAAEYFVEAWAKYGNGGMPLTAGIEESSLLAFVEKMNPSEHTWAGHLLNVQPNEIVIPIDILKNKLHQFLCSLDEFIWIL